LGTELSWLFFFSSTSRHARSKRDWSSDVCSPDLLGQSPKRASPAPDVTAQGASLRVLHSPRVKQCVYVARAGTRQPLTPSYPAEIGRASCRERVSMSVVEATER